MIGENIPPLEEREGLDLIPLETNTRRRNSVDLGGSRMIKKLRDDDYKGGWDHEPLDWLVDALWGHLKDAMIAYHLLYLDHERFPISGFIKELVDMANYAMMLVDRLTNDDAEYGMT
jgi:hypothetical protein